jgi:acyl dehydratase
MDRRSVQPGSDDQRQRPAAGHAMTTRALRSAPSILPLYARAAAPLLPGASLLPFVGGRGGELPDLELTLAGARVEPDRLAAYAHVCGLSLRETLPATYPHVLAFPLHLALVADRSFPFGAIGLVHISNRIGLHRPIHVEEPLDLSVRASALSEHPRGRTFALVSEARVGGELVWEDASTMLRRGPGTTTGADEVGGSSQGRSEDPRPKAPPPDIPQPDSPQPEVLPASSQWHLSGDLGRRYAAVSGDRNPIHMHALAAKAFGFRRAIAHGMWTKARCLASLEGLLPDAFSVEVRFRRPIELPARVAFGSAAEGDGIGFAVRDAKQGTPYLDGRVEPTEADPRTAAPAAGAPGQADGDPPASEERRMR